MHVGRTACLGDTDVVESFVCSAEILKRLPCPRHFSGCWTSAGPTGCLWKLDCENLGKGLHSPPSEGGQPLDGRVVVRWGEDRPLGCRVDGVERYR